MKKFFFLLVALLMGCASTNNISSTETSQSKKYYEIPATLRGILYGAGPVSGPITKQELEGATVSFTGEFVITPQGRVVTTSTHDENGAIVRQVIVEGGNAIRVPRGKGGVIHSVEYQGDKPTKIWVEIPGESGSSAIVPFALNRDGSFMLLLDKKGSQFIKGPAGYQFTDPDGNKFFVSAPAPVRLGKIFFDLSLLDQRQTEEGGVVLPQ